MNDDELEHARKTVLPRWFVIVLIMAAAVITAAAMSASGRPGPVVVGDRVSPSPAPVQPVTQPAVISGAPMIIWGTPIGHGDRGACTNCHRIVSREGERLPTITALSSMPHEFRGVCNNCHLVKASWLLGLLPAAAMPNPAGPNTVLGSLVAALMGVGSDG